MAKGAYIGDSSNRARKIAKMYVGVYGTARKIIKGYIGVNGVARLFFSDDDYIATELGDYLVTENSEKFELTTGMYVAEDNSQIITEDGNEWEVE